MDSDVLRFNLGADTSTPKMVSLAGLQPCYNNTTDKEHTAIANFSSRAAFLGGGIVQTITDLLIMFAKSTNSQEAYGYGNQADTMRALRRPTE